MSKKVIKEINKILQLQEYSDKEEFLDKFFSFLFVRYKFTDIKFVNLTDITSESALFSGNKFVARLKDGKCVILKKDNVLESSDIKEVFVSASFKAKKNTVIVFKLGSAFFKKVKDLEVFLAFLAKYIAQNLEIFDLSIMTDSLNGQISELKEKDTKANVSEEKVKKIAPSADEFMTMNVKNMPESFDMERLLMKIERDMMKEMFRRVGGVRTTAAKNLGITERMIGYKLTKYKIKA